MKGKGNMNLMKKKPSLGKKDAGDKNMKGRGALQRKLEGKEL